MFTCQGCKERSRELRENGQVANSGNINRPPLDDFRLQRSLKTGLAIRLATLPLILFTTASLYVGLYISDFLMGWRKVVKLATKSVLAYLYWQEYNARFFPKLGMVVSLVLGALMFEKILNLENEANRVEMSEQVNKFIWASCYPAVAVCLALNIQTRYNILRFHPESRLRVIFIVAGTFLKDYAWYMFFRYTLAPLLIDTKDKLKGSIVVAIAPLLPAAPATICTYCLMEDISKFTQREHSFIFVCLSRGITAMLYRVIHADFSSMWLFVGICLFQGFSKNTCSKIWAYVYRSQRRESPETYRDYQQFTADMEIQHMLFDCATIILGQAFAGLCLTLFCEISSPWDVLKESIVRITIGLGIDFVFNCLYIIVLVRSYNIPVPNMWSRKWKYHMLVNVILLLTISCMFKPLIHIYKLQGQFHGKHKNENCTSVFTNW